MLKIIFYLKKYFFDFKEIDVNNYSKKNIYNVYNSRKFLIPWVSNDSIRSFSNSKVLIKLQLTKLIIKLKIDSKYYKKQVKTLINVSAQCSNFY